MVCARCLESVKQTFVSHDLAPIDIKLGEVITSSAFEPSTVELINTELHEKGFELLEDKDQQLVNSVKSIIIKTIGNSDIGMNLSEYLSAELNMGYHHLSKVFSQTTGMTIERYTIMQKIEKVKELLSYGELNISEISYELGYSSVQHLSNQFKNETGMSPSEFKNLSDKSRKPLDEV